MVRPLGFPRERLGVPENLCTMLRDLYQAGIFDLVPRTALYLYQDLEYRHSNLCCLSVGLSNAELGATPSRRDDLDDDDDIYR